MKKWIALGLTLLMILSLCSCRSQDGSGVGGSIFSLYDKDVQTFAGTFDSDDVVSVFYRRNHETSEEYQIDDKETIGRLFQALSKLQVEQKTNRTASDYDDSFIFTLSDARAYTFSFNQHNLVVGTDVYTISSDQYLWGLADDIAKNGSSSSSDDSSSPASNYTIVPTKASQVTLETYQTDDFSMQIPSGWTVTTGGYGIIHTIRVYDPEQPVNQIFLLLKAQPFLYNESDKNYYQVSYNTYGGTYAVMAFAPILSDPSTENFYRIFSEYTSYAGQIEASYAGYEFPQFNDFTTLESFADTSDMAAYAINSATLHATFTDSYGTAGEGMFMADVVDFSNGNGASIGAGFYMVYNICAITSAENEFTEWQPILSQCLSSIDYTDAFVNNTMAQGDQMVSNAMSLRQTLNETSDIIMSSWESRNASEDIMRQKQTDAIMGYERVYNTDTGEIYQAPNGFTDYVDDTYYKPVTDDMYMQPVDGLIVDAFD